MVHYGKYMKIRSENLLKKHIGCRAILIKQQLYDCHTLKEKDF